MSNVRIPRIAAALAAGWLAAGCADAVDLDDLQANRAEQTLSALQTPTLTPQTSGVTTRLQAIAPINRRVVWVSGSFGVILRTTDGGTTWERRSIPGTETLAFRAIHAVTEDIAFVMT